jgi:hypothetical protein
MSSAVTVVVWPNRPQAARAKAMGGDDDETQLRAPHDGVLE